MRLCEASETTKADNLQPSTEAYCIGRLARRRNVTSATALGYTQCSVSYLGQQHQASDPTCRLALQSARVPLEFHPLLCYAVRVAPGAASDVRSSTAEHPLHLAVWHILYTCCTDLHFHCQGRHQGTCVPFGLNRSVLALLRKLPVGRHDSLRIAATNAGAAGNGIVHPARIQAGHLVVSVHTLTLAASRGRAQQRLSIVFELCSRVN